MSSKSRAGLVESVPEAGPSSRAGPARERAYEGVLNPWWCHADMYALKHSPLSSGVQCLVGVASCAPRPGAPRLGSARSVRRIALLARCTARTLARLSSACGDMRGVCLRRESAPLALECLLEVLVAELGVWVESHRLATCEGVAERGTEPILSQRRLLLTECGMNHTTLSVRLAQHAAVAVCENDSSVGVGHRQSQVGDTLVAGQTGGGTRQLTNLCTVVVRTRVRIALRDALVELPERVVELARLGGAHRTRLQSAQARQQGGRQVRHYRGEDTHVQK